MRFVNLMAIALGALLLGSCDRLANTTISGTYLPNYRYKLTVEVDTPEGVRTGSSVIEVIKPWRPRSRSRGQAVVVDLPTEQALFVLLRSENMQDWSDKAMVPAFPRIDKSGDEEADVAKLLAAASKMGRVALPRRWELTGPLDTMDHTPIMVRFRDKMDPMTVEKVNPDDLAVTFGPGFALRGIFIEITDQPVTIGLEKRLGWLDDLKRYRTNPDNPFTNTLPTEIGGLRNK